MATDEDIYSRIKYMRITPTISWSWNLDGRGFSHDVVPRRTVHEPARAQTTEQTSKGSPT